MIKLKPSDLKLLTTNVTEKCWLPQIEHLEYSRARNWPFIQNIWNSLYVK